MVRIAINGRPARVEDLHRAAAWNYGHFTSMQVRQGAVRGLELHLERMRIASRALFNSAVDTDPARIQALLRRSTDAGLNASVRVTVIPHESSPVHTDVIVAVSDPASDTPRPALRVRSTIYERDLAHLKHMATMGLTYQALQARKDGYDDVLFIGRDGLVREGSVWNVAFWDGEQVIWPKADVLPGVTMQLLQAGLTQVGVPWTMRPVRADELPLLLSAVAVNSHCPSQPIACVNDAAFIGDAGALVKALDAAWATAEWVSLD
ncbi:aminotransferase class IV [Streptomyces sp. NBC_01351]|uniref:aminotransferase class IV n=1 Tax=Streptomyces sp. NBC_01351 TaxID=2903833 RepID=UPI002E3730CF|nr:aminotransferase class IV [Streptomyces sp. NBC_01351]